MLINKNFLNLNNNYFFAEINSRIEKFKYKNKIDSKELLNLGIGDATRPISKIVCDAMKNAVDELCNKEKFRGYGPELGYNFLKEKILLYEYKNKNIDLSLDEIFISDGIASDIGNILELFDKKNNVIMFDPVYPEYLDTNIMHGRKIFFLDCNLENNFCPEIPNKKIDLIYLCNPNNPTGTSLNKNQIKKWVDYAISNQSIILYDAAYEKFISSNDVPNSIYEIDGSKYCAIEFKSFSKYASFTGVRCGFTIIPKELERENYSLNNFWSRRQSTVTNGVSYITQRGAEAIFTEDGNKDCLNNIKYYKNNAFILKNIFKEQKYNVYGGENSPYIWIKIPDEFNDSFDFFDFMLKNFKIITIPGIGFGKNGKKYIRLSSFCSPDDVLCVKNKIKTKN